MCHTVVYVPGEGDRAMLCGCNVFENNGSFSSVHATCTANNIVYIQHTL